MRNNTQKRYLIFSSIFLVAALAGILLAINLSFSSETQRAIMSTLELILQSGNSPQDLLSDTQRNASETVGEIADSTVRSPYEILETSIYFTATVVNGSPNAVKLDSSEGLSQADAAAIIDLAIYDQAESGRVGHFAYLRQSADGESKYAFLDVSERTMRQISLGVFSIAWGAVGAAILLAYVGFVTARVVRPVYIDAQESSRLLSSCADQLQQAEKEHAMPLLAEELKAGAMVSESTGRREPVALSELVSKSADQWRAKICERGGQLIESIQPDIGIKGYRAQLEMMCTVLLTEAATTMRSGGKAHIDLLSDGRSVGLIVRWPVQPQEIDSHAGLLVPCVHMLASKNGASVSFETLTPAGMCYTIKWRSAALKP